MADDLTTRDSTTRQQLVEGTIESVRHRGIAGTSVPSIARTAGVPEALIPACFGGLPELLAEAGRVSAQAFVTAFQDRFDGVSTLRELLVLGRELWAEQGTRGNVVVLSQLLAGAQGDPVLSAATGSALHLWATQVERMIRQLLAGSPLADLVDATAAARAVCASFVGLALCGAVDDGTGPFDVLEPLAGLAEELRPLERRLLYARLRSHTERRRGT